MQEAIIHTKFFTIFMSSLLLIGKSYGSPSVPVYASFDEVKKDLKINNFPDIVESTKVVHLFVVQHGTTAWNQERRFQGWSDDPRLTEEGAKEAKQLAEEISKFPIEAIYSSDLQRARQTAHIIRNHYKNTNKKICPLFFDHAFRGANHESILGKDEKTSLENDPHVKLYFSLPLDQRIFYSVADGGESVVDITFRLIPELRKICLNHENKNVVLVTHGAVLRCLNVIAHNDYRFLENHGIPRGHVMRLDVYVNKAEETSIVPAPLEKITFSAP